MQTYTCIYISAGKVQQVRERVDEMWLAGDEMWLVGDEMWLAGDEMWLAGDEMWLAGDEMCLAAADSARRHGFLMLKYI
jgi:hypothetical protein